MHGAWTAGPGVFFVDKYVHNEPQVETGMKRISWIVAGLMGLLWTAGTVWAQPANNNFANRIALTGVSNVVSGSNVGAGTESGEPAHAGRAPRVSVWWKWVAPQGGPVRITTTGSSFNTVLAVYTGSAVNDLTSIASNDNISTSDNRSSVTFAAEAGTEYEIAVDGRQAATGTIQLNLYMLPWVSLTEPVAASRFLANTNVTLQADARAANGTVTGVDFFRGTTKVGSVTAAPYAVVWSNALPGTYSLRAVVTDSQNETNTSATVAVTVMPSNFLALTLVASNSTWSYLDDGSDQGSAWIARDFDDAAWKQGPAELGYGDVAQGRPEATVVGYGPEATNKYITTYFRQSFVVQNAFGLTNLVMHLLCDDGAVVYLNGTAVWTNNMPAGPITYLTLANNAADDGVTWWATNANARLLTEGTNLLAVEMHQDAVTSSDLSFALQLDAEGFQASNQPPAVVLSSPTNGAAFGARTNLALAATVTGPNPISNVLFYANGGLLGGDTTSPYTRTFSNVLAGSYSLTAVALDLAGLAGTSAPVTITVTNVPFLVTMTNPKSGSSAGAPASFTLNATATGSVVVTNVQFLANQTLLGADATSPYSFAWSNVAAGSYSLTAIGADNTGLTATSAPVAVVVTNAPFAVRLSAPTNGAAFTAPTNLTLAAVTAGSNAVATVQFFTNGALLGADTSSPYSLVWTNASLGSNWLFAVAQDATGALATSAVVSVLVRSNTPPTVSLDSPTNNASFKAPATVVLRATATDAEGTVALVEFYADGLKVGETGASPFTFSWTNVAMGTYVLGAVAVDPGGLRATSAPVSITVVQPVGTQWVAYNDHARGTGTGANVSTYTVGTGGVAVGGPLTNFDTGQLISPNAVGVVVSAVGTVNGNAGGSAAPTTGTPADEVFAGKIDWLNSALYFGPSPYDAAVITTFTNLTPGRTYRFRASAVRGNSYPGRWTLATLAGASSATVAHLAGTGSPGLVTNGWSPYGDALAAQTQVAWNSGHNLVGDVVGWDDIVPVANSFSVICSNYHAVTDTGPLGALDATYCYAFGAFRLEELAGGAPLAIRIANPTNNQTFQAPVNVPISVQATGAQTVTNVEFYVGSLGLGQRDASPFSYVWSNAFEGTSALSAVATDMTGARATSAVVSITVTPAPTNTAPPAVQTVVPAAGTVNNVLTNVQVVFSETVSGVNASDLLLNGTPATQVSGSGAAYTFTFAQPPLGTVALTWAAGHGIQDIGTPPKPFDPSTPGNTWSYTLVDTLAPTILAKTPAAGTTVSNLTQIQVVFSEAVRNVEASDLRVNGSPAVGLSGADSNYIFSFAQPLPGTVSITWAADHGISDLAGNAFNATGAGATWQYTLPMPHIVLIASNQVWAFVKGTQEASTPVEAWRALEFDDAGWSNSPACFYYGDPLTGTELTDMNGLYSSVYLRKKFVVESPDALTNLFLKLQSDDGCVVWINGVEVTRTNLGTTGAADPFNGVASANAYEPGAGVAFYGRNLPSPASYLRAGTNVMAVHAFNASLASSSDFAIDVEFSADLFDVNALPPRVLVVSPSAGAVYALSNVTVSFSKPVANVDAADLLVNGEPALSVVGASNTYTFSFDQPAYGAVALSWAVGHGIEDLAQPPHPFDATGAGATWQYSLLNPNAPVVIARNPAAGQGISNLTSLTVTFSEPVAHLEASDLLLNGVPAGGLTGAGAVWTFTFPQPAYGSVSVSWAAAHGITDLEVPPNAFDATRPEALWSYSLVDQTPPVVVSQFPPAGASVTNLTQVNVTFSEPVTGVNASDLLVNGLPAAGVAGSGATYLFTFAQPNATTIRITWASNHGLRDLATVPNGFDATGPGATWTYHTLDTVPPALVSVTPPPGATVRSLTQIRVLFSEAVQGVDPAALWINDIPVLSGSGSDAGPYLFNFPQPPTGAVRVAWAPDQAITDLALPPNPFAGGSWVYTLNTNAQFDKQVVISEIMFHPASERTNDEWIELHNTSDAPVNLTGWRLTRGINFTFPEVSIPAGGFLVIAADTNAFHTRYPGVDNVVGNWDGQLSNAGETIALANAQGDVVDTVQYTDGGDWGFRVQGSGETRAITVTRSGTTATVTVPQGNWQNGDLVTISGANQPEYNVTNVAISGTSRTSFTYPIAGSPATPATGLVIVRQLTDFTRTGWGWSCRADGLGSSLELVNPALPNQHAQNWRSSLISSGTPGASNSVASTNAAPLLLEVQHYPVLPRSNETVTVSARLLDERSNGLAAVLFWRVDLASGTPAFTSATMYDDGQHNDGVAGDGVFAAQIPPQTNNAVVEFYVQAQDLEGQTRTWPAPALMTNGLFAQGANALYQVDDPNLTFVGTVPQPTYRLIMRWADRNELASYPGNATWRSSNARMHGSFVAVDSQGPAVRYLCGFRNRGAGTRSASPPNYKVSFPSDQLFGGVGAINLNSVYPFCQYIGYVLSLQSGLHCEGAMLTHLVVNGVNRPNSGASQYGSYIRLESTDRDYPLNHFQTDPGGNLYRGQSGGHQCTLSYLGANWASYANVGYSKQSNKSENDWADLLDLCNVLNNTPTSNYVQVIREHVNVEEWMTYFAVFQMVLSRETSIATGQGDDYSFYRGSLDKRFMLLAHDFDTILNQGDTTGGYTDSIFRMTPLATWLDRFMKHPDFVPAYYRELKRLCDTVFAPVNLSRTLDQTLQGYIPQTTIDAMKTFGSNRVNYVLSVIPTNLTVTVPLAQSGGYYSTNNATVTLYGQGDVINTRSVKVNGTAGIWSAWEGRWTNTVVLLPGVNRLLVQSCNAEGTELQRQAVEIWYDNGAGTTIPGGTMSSSVTWLAANGPFRINGSFTIPNGITLTIQPGASLFLASGVNITVANGGRLLAEGTETAPIHFTRPPGTATSWGGITINGGGTSPETRIAYAHLEFNGTTAIHSSSGTVFLDHLTFGTTAYQYLSLDSSSFVVSDCYFPTPTASFEPAHGSGGIKSGGRGLFLRNFFGVPNGYNDVIDFTGGNRPGGPIVQFINNVFTGASDDVLDLDSTDAWVEGNIFMHIHKNGSPDTSSGVSGGNDDGNASEVTILGNLFYDCDQAAMGKQGNFFTLLNNTIVHQTHLGGLDTDGAVVCLADAGTTEAAGMYLEGNIIYDAEKLVRNQTAGLVTFTNNLLSVPWSGPGGGNSLADPMFKHLPQLSETTNFTSWAQAQVLKDWFSLSSGSPARQAGPNGRDQGGVIPPGASISGEPEGTTSQTTVTLRVGVARTGSGIPTTGWPDGSGYTHYRWRLDGATWSAETPIATPISLSNLANGSHSVEVVGKRDSGWYQDDPALGSDAVVTVSRTWTVRTGVPPIRLNEILASNGGSLIYFGSTPDLIELFNNSETAVSLTGLRLTDDPLLPDKFVFPDGAVLGARQYLVVFADNPNGTPGYHTGFNLKQAGESVYLYDRWEQGGALLDAVTFGLQLTDYSIGRLPDSSWALCQPTFGAANRPVSTGDPMRLRLNEWLTDELSAYPNDFLELFNADSQPVALGGLYLTDNPMGWHTQHVVAALSFIEPGGLSLFQADGAADLGADHLNFRLSSERGMLGLFSPDVRLIDQVVYGLQSSDVSQGRSPNGSSNVIFFGVPTPGAANPVGTGGWTTNIVTTNLTLLPMLSAWRYTETNDLTALNWYATNYDDSGWGTGQAIFAFDWNNSTLVGLTNTALADPQTAAAGLTVPRVYFFRTRFVLSNDLTGFGVNASLRVDDGAILYVNGQEATRVRVNAGAYNYATLATATPTGGDTVGDEVSVLPASLFARGTNVVAAVVFQNASTSSDAVWGLSLVATRSTTNISGSGILINEVLANNLTTREPDGSTPDWVELYNPSGLPLDLAEYSLSDSVTTPRRFVFPTNSIIPALGYLRILCDQDRPASDTNTGFGLKATGGGLYFYDKPANGGTLLGSVVYGLQAPDFSLGRIPNGSGAWTLTLPTPGSLNLAAQLGNPSALRLNEWMASPDKGDDWFELWNPNSQPVALGGLYLTDDLNNRTKYKIPALSYLGASTNGYQRFWADNNPAAGADHTNFKMDGNNGEALGLFTASGAMLDGVAYAPQDSGVSEGRFPDGSAELVRFPGTASPGESNFRLLTNVVVNEALTHTDPPMEDAIELANLTEVPLAIGGWYLSDARHLPKKFRIPDGTVLAPRGFAVFYEYQFNSDPTNNPLGSFALSSAKGDEIYLSQALSDGTLTGWRASVSFGASQNGVSFGRYVTSDGNLEFVPMSARSLGADDAGTLEAFRLGTGAPNPYPKVGPIVISEIMYHPPDLGTNDNSRDEYIELLNTAAASVPLFDPAYPSNTWRLRDAVSFDFPPAVLLPPAGRLLVVNFDPLLDPTNLAAFRAKFNVSSNVLLVGPYAGKLANSDAKIELYQPDTPDPGEVPYVLVERVHYHDLSPWPTEPDGSGFSLHRISASGYANDPTNWFAAPPSPGYPLLPVIEVPPVSRTAAAGEAITLGVIAGGALPLAYQWRFNGADLLGATNPSLTLSAVQTTDAGSYVVVVTNLFGSIQSTPAVLTVSGLADSDGDGIPDWWMLQYFGHGTGQATDHSLAAQDADGDGLTNLQEYLAGTSPRDGTVTLRLDQVQSAEGNLLFVFEAVSNRTYAVEFAPALPVAHGTTILTITAAPTNRTMRVVVPENGGSGFIRVRTP